MRSKTMKKTEKFKKACMGLLLAAGMLFAVSAPANAIDFKAQGEWLVGFGAGDGNLVSKTGPRGGQKNRADASDTFNAGQRVRLQLDAVASEALSGTVFFEIGTQYWGEANANNGDGGGALGADGVVVKVKNAYLDWVVPQTELKFRMGLQAVALPNAAGGSAILDADGAAVTVSYKFNDNVGLTAMWLRPANDNFAGWQYNGDNRTHDANYLDNIDLFMLSLPLTFDGVEVTPWAMYGVMGKNALDGYDDGNFWRYDPQANGAKTSVGNVWSTADGSLHNTLINYHPGFDAPNGTYFGRTHAYGSMFWAGLPVSLSLWDPLNIEFDINYGYVEGMGRYDVRSRGNDIKRANTKRQGWLVKALVEYKLDWGVPGIFGWYASGDDGNVKNGSERMPSVAGAGNFTSFLGDGNLAWGTIAKPEDGRTYDWSMSYAGTWGVGLQLRDVSFIEDLEHTFRVALWGGTNSPSMVKYFADSNGWNNGYGADGPYMTTNDNLLEFNLVNSYKIYENLELNLELGYIVNMINKDTWDRRWMPNSYQKQDAWKAQLIFAYTF